MVQRKHKVEPLYQLKTAKKKRTKMMSMLRKELMMKNQLGVFQLNVKKKYSTSLPTLTKARLADSDQEYLRSYQKTRSSRNNSIITSSSDTDETCLSTSDLRKFKILQTLINMGVDLPNKKRISKEDLAQSDEKKVLKYLANSSRRGSLTARTLVSFQRQTSFDNESSADESDGTLPPNMPPQEKRKFASKARALSWLHGRPRGEDVVSPEPVKVVRRRRKKQQDSTRFKRLAKFVLLFLRAWKEHATRVGEVLSFVDSLQFLNEKPSKQELLFDITKYKGTKEASLTDEAKRILSKRVGDRTKDEIRYVQVALGNYKSIAAYPSNMKRLIAEKGWYEEFGSKRVIVREGHVPNGFYFILSGSALVSGMDVEKQRAQTILVLTRGDSFGELAMVNKSRRQSTVISREPLELLVLSNNDFKEIFMGGGRRDPTETFLRKIPSFKGWPIEVLSDNIHGSKNVMFSYFKRGTVLVKDSLKNDWVFIIKSGSCDVMKKLKQVDVTQEVQIKKIKDWKVKLKEEVKSEEKTGISHEEKIGVTYQDAVIQLQQIKQRLDNTLLTLSEDRLNREDKNVPERVLQISQGSSRRSGNTVRRSQSGKLSNIENLLLKKPYLSSSNSTNPSAAEIRGSEHKDTFHLPPINDKQQNNHCSHFKRVQTPPDIPIYVKIQNLVRGEVFGVSDLFFEGQARLILVSRGVECIMINKKFYKQHASHAFLTKLREKVFPYPSDDDLQSNLQQNFHWNEHKKKEIYDVIHKINVRKSLEEHNRFLLPKIQTY